MYAILDTLCIFTFFSFKKKNINFILTEKCSTGDTLANALECCAEKIDMNKYIWKYV